MAMKTEMKVLLYIKRSGQDKNGLSPLMGRIAVKGKQNSIAQFSCKFKVMPSCGMPRHNGVRARVK